MILDIAITLTKLLNIKKGGVLVDIIKKISDNLQIKGWQVESIKKLLAEGCTIPFISRYRKEATGELDEVLVTSVKEQLDKYEELEKRKQSVIKSLKDNDFYTEELDEKITKAETLSEVEDIYLPYKPKRKTRGVKAKELGLEPLADSILRGHELNISKYIKGDVKDEVTALNGAKDIIAEAINEDSRVRSRLRDQFTKYSIISTKVVKNKKEDAEKYKDYFEYSEDLYKAPSHRILAILRGVSEGVLKVNIEPDKDRAIGNIERLYSRGRNSSIINEAIEDSYKRLLKPSLENEVRSLYKDKADEKAIDVFSDNLKVLLLSAPLGEKSILAIDPGLRTGCKVACLNKQGDLIEYGNVKPLPPHNQKSDAERVLKLMVKKYKLEAVAVGNGTGGREMEDFCKSIDLGIPVILTNESGASIYSASECAREEFPDLDLTVRGAVSIGRRLMDPLAELVKIDPKSIGVGQYQHDVNQKILKETLGNCVESCVNSVGVEVNTASKELLSYVAGLNKKTAKSIIDFREEQGGINSRKDLLKVKGLGKKAYEQAAGFIRVSKSKNVLDRSSVHPERYDLVKVMAKDLGCSIDELVVNKGLVDKINIKEYVSDSVGLPTLRDIIDELKKPGRDPRDKFEIFSFDENVKEIDDLHEGMSLPGIITNVTAFGAFVDIGVHQDGLVHISQLSNSFVKYPTDIVNTGDKVNVTVLEVDKKRRRISLSMKS